MYRPVDVVPMLPNPPADELKSKPAVDAGWAAGLQGTPYEWANPGGAKMSPEQLAIMTAAYYGMVSMIDAQVGRILTALDDRRLAGHTMVIFTSDHGDL